MRIATPTSVSRLNLLNNDQSKTAVAESDQVSSYFKILRTAARTEKCDARRVGVLKVRRATRCGALKFSRGGERSTLRQHKKKN
jgi:hypothetical protein